MAAGDAVEHRVKRDGWLDWGEVGRATEGMDPNLVLVEAGRRVSDLALSDELSEIVSASLGRRRATSLGSVTGRLVGRARDGCRARGASRVFGLARVRCRAGG